MDSDADADATQTIPSPPAPATTEGPGTLSEGESVHSDEDFDSASEKPLGDEQNLDLEPASEVTGGAEGAVSAAKDAEVKGEGDVEKEPVGGDLVGAREEAKGDSVVPPAKEGAANPSLVDKTEEEPLSKTPVIDGEEEEEVPVENSVASTDLESDKNDELLSSAVEGVSSEDVENGKSGDVTPTKPPRDVVNESEPSYSNHTEAAGDREGNGLEEKQEIAPDTQAFDNDGEEPAGLAQDAEVLASDPASSEVPKPQQSASLSHLMESSGRDGSPQEDDVDETFVEAPASLDPEADTVNGNEDTEGGPPQKPEAVVEAEPAPTRSEIESDAPADNLNVDDGEKIGATSVEVSGSSEMAGTASEVTSSPVLNEEGSKEEVPQFSSTTEQLFSSTDNETDNAVHVSEQVPISPREGDSNMVETGEEKEELQFSGSKEQPTSPTDTWVERSVPVSAQEPNQENSDEVVNGEEIQLQVQHSSAMEKLTSPIDNQTELSVPTSEQLSIAVDSGGDKHSVSVSDQESKAENGVSNVANGETKISHSDVEGGGEDSLEDNDGYGSGEGIDSETPMQTEELESSQNAKQLMRDSEEPSATHSGVVSSRDFSNVMDGQIVSDSDEDAETDEEGEGKESFDSATLAALLRAATVGTGDSSFSLSAAEAARIFSVDRPAGLGSSMPSLRPGPARPSQSNLFSPSDLAVVGEVENMDEKEQKLHDKVEQIRVKFLRLVHRLGHSPEDSIAAQVLYRLSLAEGMKQGRQINRALSLESARKKAMQLEEEREDNLEFFCNVLVLGKSGVGKSATINSILGEQTAATNAFQPATTSVREIIGVVDGVKLRFIDTPGLKSSVMDHASNRKILSSIKKYTKKCPPDIVLYVDRLDTQTRDFNDLPLFRAIASTLGSSIWLNVIVALTHGASAPPDGPSGTALSYDVFVAQRSHVVQHSIRQAAGDMRLMNPVALVENHPSCRRNREGQRVLPNGVNWRSQLLLLCYSSKILAEANALFKLQDSSPGKLFGFRVRSPPLPYLLSSLLQSRPHPKLSNDQDGGGDSDVDLGDLSDSDPEEDEFEYDQLPPFKPLKKAQIAMLTKKQKKAYFDEYDYRMKLLQKKQLKEELRRLKEVKKKGKGSPEDSAYGDVADDYDQDAAPASVPVPLPDMVLPPSFDCENAAYRYRFLEPTTQILSRPVLDTHGWDHDCGYDGVSLEINHALAGQFPAGAAIQITKDKKEFNIHLDSSVAAKHGESGSTLAGFDVQNVGKQLAYILRGETKFKNLKKNKTAAGVSVTFLGEHVATGLKMEDQLLIGKRVSLVASTGAIRSQGDIAYGANLEARLREKDFPIGQEVSTLGLSLMKWKGDLALGANLQSQFSIGRNSKVAVRVGVNNKLTGQITVRTSTSEQLQIALLGVLPIAMSIFRSVWPGESYMAQ